MYEPECELYGVIMFVLASLFACLIVFYLLMGVVHVHLTEKPANCGIEKTEVKDE